MANNPFQKPSRQWAIRIIIPLSILILGIAISILLSQQAAKMAQEEKFTQFREASLQATNLLQEKVNRFPQLLKSTRGMIINADFEPSQQSWRTFFSSLNLDYKELGIIGITYTQYVHSSVKDDFISKSQERYGDTFKIFPENPASNEHFVIMHAVPDAVIGKIRGFDIGTETNRAEAARYALNSGQISTSDPISLLPTDNASLDYLMLAPIHRSLVQPDSNIYIDADLAFAGWATIGFSLSLLVEQTLAAINEPLRIQIYDSRKSETAPSFDSGNGVWSELQANYANTHVLNLSDQRIRLNILPPAHSPRIGQTSNHNTIVLFSGIVVSALTALTLFLLLQARYSALRLASVMQTRSQESSDRYRALFDQSPEAIIIHINMHIVLCNYSALNLLNASSLENVIGLNILDLVHEDSQQLVKERVEALQEKQQLEAVEQRILRLDGSDFLAEVSSACITYDGMPGVQVMFRDISTVKQRRDEARIARRVLEHTNEAIMVTNESGEIIMTNPAFSNLTGFSKAETLQKHPSMLGSGHHDSQFFADLWHQLNTTGHWRGELVNRRKDGQIYIQKTNISAVFSKSGSISHFVCLMSDITEQKKALDSIRFQAMHDNLTKLPNRSNFEVRAEDALRLAEKNNTLLSILFIDLDGFKPINDQYGHLTGDQLLKTLANRLRSNLDANHMVSRIGGDEFLVLFESPKTLNAVIDLANNLLGIISEPVQINNTPLSVSASIGIATFPENGASIAKLINQADKAMYRAKDCGKGQVYCATSNRLIKTAYS